MDTSNEFTDNFLDESSFIGQKYRKSKPVIDSEDELSAGEEENFVTSDFSDLMVNDSLEEEDQTYTDLSHKREIRPQQNNIFNNENIAENSVYNAEGANEEENNLTDEEYEVVNTENVPAIYEGSGYELSDDDDIVKGSDDDDIVKGSDDEVNSQGIPLTEDSDIEAIPESVNVIELSSEDEVSTRCSETKTIPQLDHQNHNVQTKVQNSVTLENTPPALIDGQTIVKRTEYAEQVNKIANIEQQLTRAKNAKQVIKLENLPDKGKSLIEKELSLERILHEQKQMLSKMTVKDEKMNQNKVEIKWDEIEAGVNAVEPRTFGKKGVERFRVEKTLAMETLDELHNSLATCPTEKDMIEDPKGLRVPLMTHQKRALAWLLWRENQKPSGGLLADDMGLGKTLTMISLVIKSLELESGADQDKENHRNRYPGGSLVVCPASLINQWSGEIERRTKRGLLSFEVYHGAKRETKPKRLAKNDVVITTYAIVLSESDRNGALFGVRWRRIILDEAHQIRNHKARTSEAVYKLSGRSRWALTGTPVHNKELDMYSLLKFLRCSPFDDLQVWKHWVSDKSTGGQMRLQAVISSLMLRRTKNELMNSGILQGLPEKTWELISIKLEQDEMNVYQKVLIFSRTLFAQFLHQRAEKNQDNIDLRFNYAPPDPNGEYFKMRNKLLKLNRVKEVNQHDILVLLLRLRQICCHPSLIIQMLQEGEDLGEADSDGESEEMNLLDQLNKLNLDDEEDCAQGLSSEAVGIREASKGFLNRANPVFMEDRPSSKIKALVKLLKEKISNGDKAIIVSQWTGLLSRVAIQLKAERVIYDSLDGSIPVNKRMPVVDNFNDPQSDTKVLLLSLTAGGVGLNLVGANHLFLMDLHWNPQLENQAQDRIYRMGQKKPIFVYKLMAADTIEERIKTLQEKKLEIADSMLTGSKKVASSKLTLQDLKLLFDFK